MKIKSKITGQPVTLSEEHTLAIETAEECYNDGFWSAGTGWKEYADDIARRRDAAKKAKKAKAAFAI